MTTKSSTATQLSSLPILKHFDESQINTNIDSFRKGEKGILFFLKLGAIVGLGYLTWIYVLPPIFIAIGKMLALVASGVILVAAVMLFPVLVKVLRKLTRQIHKAVIKHDPFAELENQKQRMLQNQQQFRAAKGKILALKSDMEIEADRSEKDAETMQKKILTIHAKAEKMKLHLDDMVKNGGIAAKGEDEYINTQAELTKLLSESNRISHKLNQSKDFVQKYGTRANIMKKFGQKLTMVETSMDIKVLDFDATIEILKKDYEFAQKSREATESAKSAMLFSKSWELDYALDVVASTIAQDISITSGNLKDIDSLTSQYAVDSDELYSNLNLLADKIKVGGDVIPDARAYSNPEYQLTSSDRNKSGGFDNLF